MIACPEMEIEEPTASELEIDTESLIQVDPKIQQSPSTLTLEPNAVSLDTLRVASSTNSDTVTVVNDESPKTDNASPTTTPWSAFRADTVATPSTTNDCANVASPSMTTIDPTESVPIMVAVSDTDNDCNPTFESIETWS
jgi:hypothetical protein